MYNQVRPAKRTMFISNSILTSRLAGPSFSIISSTVLNVMGEQSTDSSLLTILSRYSDTSVLYITSAPLVLHSLTLQKWLLNSSRMFALPDWLLSLRVGFRFLDPNLLRHDFQKLWKYFLHKWSARLSLNSSSAEVIASLMAYLYFNFILTLFSLISPERGHPYCRQVLVISIHSCFKSSSSHDHHA